MDKIKVLIVDDSALVRQTLSDILKADSRLEIMGVASDPYYAAQKIAKHVPDVITLDIEMPRMDGLTFLKKIMHQHPIPVVICSSLAADGSQNAIRAMEYGAVEIINKETIGTRANLQDSATTICDIVVAASSVHKKKGAQTTQTIKPEPKLNADAVIPVTGRQGVLETTEMVIAVGASTGGTEALRIFLEALDEDAPGIVIVQHMPEGFTSAFSKRLDTLCRVSVKEAQNNDTLIPGRVLIAPGNHHLILKRSGARYFAEIKDGPLVSRHRPSVDVLFRSAARYAGQNAIGVIMTGMGDDGAR
ncbi:MAG: chemotaxis response regulator protein-glutamate methylesterase, partial [Thermodesulfobacteriota bacterium]|nr:chemotaxis response regulator protein-glutamate methylesterase [Thermodesulfobacteriota bacterium]